MHARGLEARLHSAPSTSNYNVAKARKMEEEWGEGENLTFPITIRLFSSQQFPKAHSFLMDTSKVPSDPVAALGKDMTEGRAQVHHPIVGRQLCTVLTCFTQVQPDSNARKVGRSFVFQRAGLVAPGTAQNGILKTEQNKSLGMY